VGARLIRFKHILVLQGKKRRGGASKVLQIRLAPETKKRKEKRSRGGGTTGHGTVDQPKKQPGRPEKEKGTSDPPLRKSLEFHKTPI